MLLINVSARLCSVVTVICCISATACTHLADHGVVASGARVGSMLVLADRVDHVERLAREPMVVEHSDGSLFVSGYDGEKPNLWKSRDHGSTWTLVDVGSETDGATGNSDVDLAIARDGTLYFVTMGFNSKTNEGTHIAIGVSKDAGATWHWNMLSHNRFDDRPWVAVAANGTAHVIWNDGSGVRYAISRDGGATWIQRPRIHGQGGSSHLAVGPNQEVAVRVTPASASCTKLDPGVDIICVSSDGGATWQEHPAPGQRLWSLSDDDLPRWVEPLAWDARGALYSFWTHSDGLWLARSLDRGVTWTNWHVAAAEEISYFPYLIARGRGELAATWFSGRKGALVVHVGRLNVTDSGANPRFIEVPPFQVDSWQGNPPIRDTAGEYLGVTFLRSGGLGLVSPIQNQQEKRFGFTWWRFEAN